MSQIGFHIAGALITLLGVLCLLSAAVVIIAVDGVVGVSAGVLAALVTFQALRVPVGRTAVRMLER
ncbi:MAG TPA: hypothetical protein VHF51_17615 [Solirubrobacteraceae bacterium]|jgi:hypothetical protein|nr:hypothetical protein [Solirubrobacteraceae bacterium]